MLQEQSLEGLSEREAVAQRVRGYGNDRTQRTGRTYWQIVREAVFPLVNTILYVLCIALLLLGQISAGLISLGVVLLNVLISVIQEVRAKRLLDRITLLTRPKATVIRDGQERVVDPGELVLGDLLMVQAGGQIVVDGPVVSDARLEVDESLLTGESVPVPKQAGDILYSGSFCLTGRAYYRAEKVGSESVAGQLTAGARTFRRVWTPLQRTINSIIQSLLLVALYIESVLILYALANRASIVDVVSMSVVVVGIVPIGLLLASSVAYALAALQIAGKNALVQRLSAIESLSNVQVLCLDKTGTLTTNALVLEHVHAFRIPEAELRHLLGVFTANVTSQNTTSRAINAALQEPGRALPLREEIPFSSSYKWSGFSSDDADLQGIYILGAPEVLTPFLHPGADLGTFGDAETALGRRVLLFACFQDLVPLRTSLGEPVLPTGMIPLGMVSLSDELRPQVRETLAGFTQIGIQIKVISGDNPQTVAALAQQVGIAQSERLVSGSDLATMDDAHFAQAAEQMTIFGRITPEQKSRLVQALRGRQWYVAMVGDGVNDVLSLKQANLSIAMESGSQATRAVADMVLLDDSFAALPLAFAEGQRVRNGMWNVIKLFLTRISYLVLLLFIIPIAGGFPFAPQQASILQFITASIISVAVVVWARPGLSSQKNVARSFVSFILPATFTQSLIGFAVYALVLQLAPQSGNEAEAQAVAQSALTTFSVLGGLLMVPFVVPPTTFWTGGSELSGDWRPSVLALGMLVVFLLIVVLPGVRAFFSLTPLDDTTYLLIAGAVILWGLLQRWLWRVHFLERFLQME